MTAADLAEALGVAKTTVIRRAQREGWPSTRGVNRVLDFPLEKLPVSVRMEIESRQAAPDLPAVHSSFASSLQPPASSLPQGPALGNPLAARALDNADARRRARIVSESERPPAGCGKRAWVNSLALENGVSPQTIYKWKQRYSHDGLGGLLHVKSNAGQAREWDEAALDYWIGLVLKREHRKMSLESIYYNGLVPHAHSQGWRIGSLSSAEWWARKRVTPQLEAYRDGGRRKLDNTLTPIYRSYADLRPMQILVGDQHRFDFWVCDSETGEVFRPEGYLWRDLRTRLWYGAAVDHKYDSQLIGLSLRVGCRIWGAPEGFYNDNGKPELSRYTLGIMRDLRSLSIDPLGDEDLARTQRLAIVKNAKAKMIESSFRFLERIMRDQGVPGHVKDLGGDPDENDVDMGERDRWARDGKLLSPEEFGLALFKALDHDNNRKHSGVLSEWYWAPRPKKASPMDCLRACIAEGWRPRPVRPETADAIFLPRFDRVVVLGCVTVDRTRYSHEALLPLNGQTVQVRRDPMDPEWALVVYDGEAVCVADSVVYGSMINPELTSAKIAEKARIRKRIVAEYKRLTSPCADLTQYSLIGPLDRAAALLGTAKQQRAAAAAELTRPMSAEELAADVAELQAAAALRTTAVSAVNHGRDAHATIPARPPFFLTTRARYAWLVKFETANGDLTPDDQAFKSDYEAAMSSGEARLWAAEREYGS